jgi:hypothetical protein
VLILSYEIILSGPPTFIQSDQSLQLSRDSVGSSDPDNNVQPSHVSRARTRAPPIPVRHVRSGSSPRDQRQQASPRLSVSPSQTFVHGGISIAFSTTPPKDQRSADSGVTDYASLSLDCYYVCIFIKTSVIIVNIKFCVVIYSTVSQRKKNNRR